MRGLRSVYSRALRYALGHRKTMVAFGAAFLAVVGLLIPRLGTEFLPTLDEGDVFVFTEMPPSISHERAQLLRILFTGAMLACLAGGSLAAPAGTAPDFTLRTADGRNLRLHEQRGRVVLMNFWATWCGPCRQEMPLLNQLHQKYQAAGLTLLGINVDDDSRQAHSPLLAILSARHEVQYSRLFRS